MLTRLRAGAATVRTRAVVVHRDDSGVSLAETLVAMALATVIGAISLSFFVWVGRATGNAAESSYTTDSARLAVSSMAATLRLADTPTSQPGATDSRILDPLSRTTIAFFANDNGNRAGSAARALPTRIVYTAANGTVTEARYQPLPNAVAKPTGWTANYPSAPTSTRTLLRGAATVRFDYDVRDATTGAVTRVDPAADPSKTLAAQLAAVTMTVTTAAVVGRPAQTFTATAVLTGSTS